MAVVGEECGAVVLDDVVVVVGHHQEGLPDDQEQPHAQVTSPGAERAGRADRTERQIEQRFKRERTYIGSREQIQQSRQSR